MIGMNNLPFPKIEPAKYSEIIEFFMETGEQQNSRLGSTREIIGAQFEFSPYVFPYRPRIARKLGMVELLQVLSGYFDERHLKKAAPNLRYDYGLTHAYGIKIAQQLERVSIQLHESFETRRALLHIGKPEDGAEVEKPCIQMYQFLGRRNPDGTKILNLIATVRSWDLVSGFPYDAVVMGGVLQAMCRLHKAIPGSIIATAGSAHVYENVWSEIKLRGKDMPIRIADNYFAIWRKFDNLIGIREWAIDQLNDMDNWNGSVPYGIEYASNELTASIMFNHDKIGEDKWL